MPDTNMLWMSIQLLYIVQLYSKPYFAVSYFGYFYIINLIAPN